MIKILYVAAKFSDFSKGCFKKLDPIFCKDVGRYDFDTPESMNMEMNVWLKQFGGRLEWSINMDEPDFIIFEDGEDATAFALKFDIMMDKNNGL